jgi:hypothetical protein
MWGYLSENVCQLGQDVSLSAGAQLLRAPED